MIILPSTNMKLKAALRLFDSRVIWATLILFVLLTCCCGLAQGDRKSMCIKKYVVHQNPKDGICGTMDIRNNVTNLRNLENCTIIEGNVWISLILRSPAEEFDKYSFPLLTEITGHLMLFRVKNLRSLRKLFPNLAIIRGQDLFYNYALVIFDLHLEDIGLINLRTIIRGGVQISKNKRLCHVDTVDWSRIAIGAEPSELHFMGNKEERHCANYCPDTCPTTIVDNTSAKRCWTSDNCQKNLNCRCGDNRPCMDNGTCCHKFCMGGCRGPGPSDCLGCKGVVYKNTCQPRCPPYTYMFSETRCLTDKECLSVRNRTWNGGTNSKLLKAAEKGEQNRCVVGDCPPGYMVAEEGGLKGFECVKCKDYCPKVCNSTEVNSIQDLQRLKGCSKIIGPLVIQIMGGSSVNEEMEKNLGEIREVTGYINIRSSYALLHLYFFKKLEIIRGETLAHRGHSLVVMDNANLQELFPKGQKIQIKRGQVEFHSNRRLCLYKIKEFVKSLNLTVQPGPQDISEQTNGDLKPCYPRQMSLKVTQITHESAVLVWEKDLKDSRQVLTYNINYKEVPSDDSDVNIYLGRDACSDDVWMNKEQQPTEDNEPFQMGLLPKLKAYTKYAAYVQAFTLTTATHSAMTNIITFYTLPYYPTEPLDLQVSPTEDPTELHVKWKPPKHPNGIVTYYKLIYMKQPLNLEDFDRRNYCLEPLVETKDKSKAKVEEEQKKQNVSGNCCACPKSKKELEKERDKRKMEVFFENHLQNNVYCKRFDTLPTKVIIDKNLTQQWENMNREGLSMGGKDFLQSMIKGLNGTINLGPGWEDRMAGAAMAAANANDRKKMSYSPMGIIGDIDVYNFTETVINNLEPFMEYVIELQACQDTSPHTGGLCSNSRAITAGRTKALPSQDNVNETSITVEHVTNTTGDVIIRWTAPPRPNGLILKYSLKVKRAGQDNLVAREICINRRMYEEIRGYRLKNLDPGNWTYQIFAMSLTGKSSETKEKYFIIDQQPGESDNNIVFVVGVVIAFLFLLLIGLLIVVVLIKHRYQARDVTVISENRNYLASSDLINTMDGWEVDRDKIKLLQPLGKGSFGMVYKGIAKGIGEDPEEEMWVAVKTVNDRANFFDRRDFLKEATTMKAFDCYHVVKLLGVVSTGQPALVIMELMATDLKNYLREHRPDELEPGMNPPRIQDILQMAGEIADGMAYLADKKFVHRDLAARNCMVAEDATVKIGDFGMARDIYETDYYRKGGRGMLPVRWMAPESLRDGVFTSLSDVWSYGVVLWEMVTLAAQPYQGLSNEDVVKYVSDGNTMVVPEQCPKQMEILMKKCWKKQRERPTFLDIIHYLEPYLSAKFRELSFYFSSGSHRSHRGDGGGCGGGVGLSGSPPHDVFEKESESNLYSKTSGAFACHPLSGTNPSDLEYQSQSSMHSGTEEGINSQADLEFCKDKSPYNGGHSTTLEGDDTDFSLRPLQGHNGPRGDIASYNNSTDNSNMNYNDNRYNCDGDADQEEDDDDESDVRCLMLGGGSGSGGVQATKIQGSPFYPSPLSMSPPHEPDDISTHPQPSSPFANQGQFELQPLIAPSANQEDGHDLMPGVTSTSAPSLSTSSPSSSWNPHPHHYKKSSLPTNTDTSPVNNGNTHKHQMLSSSPTNCSPVTQTTTPSDYLGYNPSPSRSHPPSQLDNITPITPASSISATQDNSNQQPVASGLWGTLSQPPASLPSSSSSLSTPPPPSSSSSSNREGGELDRLLWPSTGSSRNNNKNSNNNNSNNSISRPSLRLPVLNRPPGGSFHQAPPTSLSRGGGSTLSQGDTKSDKSAGSQSPANALSGNSGIPSLPVEPAGRLTEKLGNIGDGDRIPPLHTASSSSPPSSSSSSLPTPPPSYSLPSSRLNQPSKSILSSSSNPSHGTSGSSAVLDTQATSSDGSKDNTKSNKSSTGSSSSHTSMPLMNGYTNGHAPNPPPPSSSSSSSSSSSIQPQTALC